MKATGIVRRIDDLGRIVIPKEIRRTMRIREGDALEIFTSADGEVVFKKYSPVGEMAGFVGRYAEVLSKLSGLPALICDRDHVVAAAGMPKRDVLQRRISASLEQLTDARKSYLREHGTSPLQPAEGCDSICVSYPILSDSDVTGSVMLLGEQPPTEVQLKLTQAAASFLGRQMES